VEKYVRARWTTNDNTVGPMLSACWITRGTETFRILYIYIYTYFFTATMVTPTHQNVTFRYVACLSRNMPVSDTVQFLLMHHVISSWDLLLSSYINTDVRRDSSVGTVTIL